MATISCAAVLFDLDGVLIDSTPLVKRLWETWAVEHDLDPDALLASAFGQRIIDTMTRLADAGVMTTDRAIQEAAIMEERAQLGSGEIEAMPGAGELLRSMEPDAWAVVTGETRRLATIRMGVAALPVPDVLVTADDVAHGKPDPESYLLAGRRLGADPSDAVVVEDTPMGIEAGRAAGMRVVAVATTYPSRELERADVCIGGVGDILVRIHDGVTLLTL